MPFDAPFNLGPFAVDAAGRLTPRHEEPERSGFILAWRGRSVHAYLSQAEQGSRLVLQVALGRIPSTAGETTEDQRPRSFAALRALPGALPDGWRLRLTPDHRLRLKAERLIELPITVTLLVTELTCFLLTLAPFLDLLDEVGVPVGPALSWERLDPAGGQQGGRSRHPGEAACRLRARVTPSMVPSTRPGRGAGLVPSDVPAVRGGHA